MARARIDGAWAALREVPDPEIPVVSIVDLGIVRAVELDGAVLVVALTPTYSGCPATEAIRADVEAALQRAGVGECRLVTRLAPPWTTDWITDDARERLRAYGIAPPGTVAADPSSPVRIAFAPAVRRGPQRTACPRCGSLRTDEISAFGSTPCKSLRRCLDCREPFDAFKPL